MVAVVVCSSVAVGSAGAARVQAFPTVRWYVDSNPSCPTLHGDSIDGGTGSFIINDVLPLDIHSGDKFVLDLSAEEASVSVFVREIIEGEIVFQSQDATIFCRATTPLAPTNAAATPANGSATVSWTAPSSDGGAPIRSYMVTQYVGDVSELTTQFANTNTTQTLNGLTNGTEYRFRVHALNEIGEGLDSDATKPITVGTPTAPTIGTATAATQSATVSWTPPATDNGSPITAYVVTAYVGYNPVVSVLAGPAATTRTVGGLTPGTTYRFRVRPHNAWGAGAFSTASNAATPAA